MDNKKYYYMRIKENFFDTNEIVLLESMQDGYLYSNILLKLYLRSLKDDGKLMFNDRIPYNAQMIATITRHQAGTVEKALQIFQEMELIEVLDNGAIYMLDIQQFIGTSSTEADRVRNYRKKIEAEKLTSVQMYDKCTPEIEIDIEKEIEKDKEIELDKELDKNIWSFENSLEGNSSELQKILDTIVISLPLKSGDVFPIYEDRVKEWEDTYTNVDVIQQLKEMKTWLNNNPSKKKTRRGILRFVNGWLQRENKESKPKQDSFNITKFDII